MTDTPLYDDPSRDFRQRYKIPEHFLWDEADLPKIDYDGYIDIAIELLPPAPADVLDVGSGDGWFAAQVLERGHRVVGVDYSERGVAFARILVPKAEFQVVDARLLSEQTTLHGRFDAALLIEVIEHIPPDYHKSLLEGVAKCLKPGGRLIFSVPTVRMPLNKWHYKHFLLEDALALLRSAGFEPETTVFQNRLHWLFSRGFWRWVQNRYYDLKAVRRWLRRRFLKHYNRAPDERTAGRIIIASRVRKSGDAV
jgi:SAM-dependent methyltransferase